MFFAFSLYLIGCFCPLDLSFAGPAIPRYTEPLITILQPGKRSDSLHLPINGNTTEKKRETLHFLATACTKWMLEGPSCYQEDHLFIGMRPL